MKKTSKIFGLTNEEILEVKKQFAEKRKDPSFKIFSKEDMDSNELYQKSLQQSKEFMDKFSSDWLKRKIKLIISKYDWVHSPLDVPEDCMKDPEKYLKHNEIYFAQRKDFFDMMSSYLVVFEYPELDI
jgi:hypothetical protein